MLLDDYGFSYNLLCSSFKTLHTLDKIFFIKKVYQLRFSLVGLYSP